MNAQTIDTLIATLRHELEEYGAMLVLINEQQSRIIHRDATEVSALAERIEAQSTVLLDLRQRRENLVRGLARHYNTGTATIQSVGRHTPGEISVLLDGLVQELNQTIQSLRRRSRQNQMLLARLVEVHQALLPAVRPAAYAKTYSARGQVNLALVDSFSRRQFSV